MPKTFIAKSFDSQKRITRNNGATRNEWKLKLDEFELIIKRGCYVCSTQYEEGDQMYTKRTTFDNYDINNTITLCHTCSQALRSRDVPNFLKILVHIGSRMSDDRDIDYYDAFCDDRRTISYDKWISNGVLDTAEHSKQQFMEVKGKDCKYCDRASTKQNYNRAVIRTNKRTELIPLCSTCESIYNLFDSEKMFENYILKVRKNAERKINRINLKSKLLIASAKLHIYAQSDKTASEVSYSDTQLCFINMTNGVWSVNTRYDQTDPNLLAMLESENYKFIMRDNPDGYSDIYSHETCMIDHHNRYIDSILFSPTKSPGNYIVDSPYTQSSTHEQLLEHIVNETYPAQMSSDSKLQLGIVTQNTKLLVKTIYSTKTEKIECIKIYGNMQSITQCQCNSNICSVCISNAYDRQKGVIKHFSHDYDVTNITDTNGFTINKSQFVKRACMDYSNMSDREKAHAYNQYNLMYDRSKALQNIQDHGEQYQKELRAAHRRKYAANTRKVKKIAKDPQTSRNEFKQRQIDLYGEERYSQITSLQQRIYRAKKKEGFPNHTMNNMLEQLAVLKAGP